MSDGEAPALPASRDLRVRPERPEDAAFLFRLFSLNATAVLDLADLSEAMRDPLVAMQHRARDAAYRKAFPNARFGVVEVTGAPVGRLVEDDEADAVHIVDIAFLPEHQGRGLGRAVVSRLIGAQAASGRGVRAQAAVTNAASLRLFTGLGFAAVHPPGSGHVNLVWRPSSSTAASS